MIAHPRMIAHPWMIAHPVCNDQPLLSHSDPVRPLLECTGFDNAVTLLRTTLRKLKTASIPMFKVSIEPHDPIFSWPAAAGLGGSARNTVIRIYNTFGSVA